MANPHRGEASFKIGGVDYTLAFTTNAICELEELLDRSFKVIVQDMGRLSHARALLWAGLRVKHPAVTLEMAGEIIDTLGMKPCADVIGKALANSFPKADESASKNG